MPVKIKKEFALCSSFTQFKATPIISIFIPLADMKKPLHAKDITPFIDFKRFDIILFFRYFPNLIHRAKMFKVRFSNGAHASLDSWQGFNKEFIHSDRT